MISFCVGFPPFKLIFPPDALSIWLSQRGIVKASFKQQSQWEMGKWRMRGGGELEQQRKKIRLSNGILHVICIFHWQMIWLGCKFDNFKWQWQLRSLLPPHQLPSHPIQRLQLQLLLQFMHSSGSTTDADADDDEDDDEAAGSSCI